VLLSVLIAAYHAGAHLPAALATLAAQTHPSWELIVVEDGSRDQTEALVAAFAETHPARRVVYHNLGQNQGVASARTQLLTPAQGAGCAFLDADDRWSEDHLAAAAAALSAGADLALAPVRTFALSTDATLGHHPVPPTLLTDPVAALLAGSPILTSSCVVLRRELATRLGPFDPQLKVGEDRDYWLRAALAGARFAALSSLCHYAKHPGSTMARTLLVAEQSRLFALKYHRHLALPRGWGARSLANAELTLARLTRAQSPRRSARHAWAAWRARSSDLRPLAHLAAAWLRAPFVSS
jgi:glycosyltransferase involved in cell wall biosynthesis